MIEALCASMQHFGATTFTVVAPKQVKLYLHDRLVAMVLLRENGTWTRLDKAV